MSCRGTSPATKKVSDKKAKYLEETWTWLWGVCLDSLMESWWDQMQNPVQDWWDKLLAFFQWEEDWGFGSFAACIMVRSYNATSFLTFLLIKSLFLFDVKIYIFLCFGKKIVLLLLYIYKVLIIHVDFFILIFFWRKFHSFVCIKTHTYMRMRDRHDIIESCPMDIRYAIRCKLEIAC